MLWNVGGRLIATTSKQTCSYQKKFKKISTLGKKTQKIKHGKIEEHEWNITTIVV